MTLIHCIVHLYSLHDIMTIYLLLLRSLHILLRDICDNLQPEAPKEKSKVQSVGPLPVSTICHKIT